MEKECFERCGEGERLKCSWRHTPLLHRPWWTRLVALWAAVDTDDETQKRFKTGFITPPRLAAVFLFFHASRDFFPTHADFSITPVSKIAEKSLLGT